MPEPHQTDHDLLIRLDENVKELIRRFDAFLLTQTDHERRLKTLELWRAWILGAAAVVGALSSIIMNKI